MTEQDIAKLPRKEANSMIKHMLKDQEEYAQEIQTLKKEIKRLNMIRPAVIKFAKEMEKKLKENDHKVHWSKCSLDYLACRLHQEWLELIAAIEDYKTNPNDESKLAVIQEAADCGNFSMMIADNLENDFKENNRRM